MFFRMVSKSGPIFFSILSQITRLTDRRTDGQTDRRTDRILIARPRLHFMQRGKNSHAQPRSTIWRSTVPYE